MPAQEALVRYARCAVAGENVCAALVSPPIIIRTGGGHADTECVGGSSSATLRVDGHGAGAFRPKPWPELGLSTWSKRRTGPRVALDITIKDATCAATRTAPAGLVVTRRAYRSYRRKGSAYCPLPLPSSSSAASPRWSLICAPSPTGRGGTAPRSPPRSRSPCTDAEPAVLSEMPCRLIPRDRTYETR